MSHTITIACDLCGVTKPDEPALPWWDFQYSSLDYPIVGGFEFKSGSWDLCGECARVGRAALVAAIGEPQGTTDPIP